MSIQFASLIKSIKDLTIHTLYAKLIILIFCITSSLILMQAGSLFLLDYTANNQKVIQDITKEQIFWQHFSDTAIGEAPEKLTKAILKADPHLRFDLGKMVAQINSHDATQVNQLLQKLREAREKISDSHFQQASITSQRLTVQTLISSYEQLVALLLQEVEAKQSVISLLQLLSIYLAISCLITIAFRARKLLVHRLDTLVSFADQDAQHEQSEQDEDEFVKIERLVYETSARLEGFKAENEWFNQNSSERLRRLIRSQDFLHEFVESINNTLLSETVLRKSLFSLEKALNILNVSLIFTENDLGISTERVLFSNHKPEKLSDAILEDLTTTNLVRFCTNDNSSHANGFQCIAVGFVTPTGALGVLQVEADIEHVFDETETQLIELTAHLLSMVMGFQGREQEGRRLALLEERAAIARELHDSLAQSLSFMKIQISRLQSASNNQLETNEFRGIVNELRDGLNTAYRELRELLATFRVHMDVRGLNSAIQTAIDEFSQRSNLSISLDNRLINCRLTVNEEFHILHVLREALSNVVRHANASRVEISLNFQSSGTIIIIVDDDGIGYTATEASGHYGQSIMQERAESLGGNVAVLRRKQGGTRVRLIFTPQLPQS